MRGQIEGACSYCAAGSLMTIAFELQREKFVVLNGGPELSLTNAVSLVVNGDSQEVIDHYWEKLAGDGGEQLDCG
ncbi:MAG: VOC family protein [Chthoniobacterales bacterium]